MMTAIVQEAPPHQTAVQNNAIPPHVLIVGKKNAVDYIAPALFRLGSFGELVVRAKGSFSIVTAVNVAEMVKRDVEGLEARPVIGTEEVVIEGVTRRVSFIEIHLAKPAPKVEAAPAAAVVVEVAPAVVVEKEVPVVEAPVVAEAPVIEAIIEEAAPAIAAPAEKLAQAASKSKKIRAKAKTKTSTATTKRKAPARKKKAE